MELKNVSLMKDSFIENLSILHLKILTDGNKLEHCFLGIPRHIINDKKTVEEWFKEMHPFNNKDTARLVQTTLPKTEREGILWRKF